MDTQPTFYKMRMTGPRCAEMITQPLQAIRELNPSLNAMIQSTEQMNKVLCEAAKQPLKKRRKIASSAVAIHDAHLQRLKAFRSGADHTFDPLVQALAQQPPSAPAAPPPHVEEETEEEEDVSSLSSRAGMQRVMAAIPKQYRPKAAMLRDYLKAHPDIVRITPRGQPIVGGVEIRHANIQDVMRSLYVWPKSQALPRGTNELVAALHSVGVPTYLLSNATIRGMYQRLHEPGEQPHAETQTEPELEMEEELEHGEKLPQTPEGKHREAEEFATAQHLPFPPQPTVSKVGALALAKPETKKFSSFLAKVEASKPSGIPTRHASDKPIGTRGKQTSSSEASTSQEGHGYKANGERVCLPGKPIRILRLPSFPEKPTKRRARKATVNQMEQRRKDVERGRLPGQPIRILRLY